MKQLLLNEKEIKQVLKAINNIKEYSTEWEELYSTISEQTGVKE